MGTTPVVTEFPPQTGTQYAGAAREYRIDVTSRAVSAWQPNISIDANELIRPTAPNQNGFIYQNGLSPGQTGPTEPNWINGTVTDGSLTWTALAPPTGSEDSIQSVVWSQSNPPDGMLTIVDQANDVLTASAFIGGGTSGQTYLVVVTITMASGQIYPVKIYVTVL